MVKQNQTILKNGENFKIIYAFSTLINQQLSLTGLQ